MAKDQRVNSLGGIRSSVEEMMERFEGAVKYNQEDEDLQKEFESVVASCGKLC